MSWSRPFRIAALAVALAAPAALAGCSSFAPVYGTSAAGQAVPSFSFAPPGNRLEQVVIQELELRFGDSGGVPVEAVVTTITQVRNLARSRTTNPGEPIAVTVTATLTAQPSGAAPWQISRRAEAHYTRSGQVLADTVAAEDAAERAAKAAAESLRLAILAGIAGR
jgi:hypothetical protein